jgi:Ca2+-transporting ATPase
MLVEMVESKSLAEFQALGGLDGIARGLRTDLRAGLGIEETFGHDGGSSMEDSVLSNVYNAHCKRMAVFGTNRLPHKKTKNVFQFMLKALSDKMLILFSVAAFISLSAGLYEDFGQPHAPDDPRTHWIDSIGMVLAICVFTVVSALNDYQMERQFASLAKKVPLNQHVFSLPYSNHDMLLIYCVER